MDRVTAELNRIPLGRVGDFFDKHWFDRWHWTRKRASNQYCWYRCKSCHAIVTWRHISEGGCKCGSARISPTMPLFMEKLRLLFLPWTIYV